MKKYTQWTELPHPLWGLGSKEYSVHKIVKTITFPKKIWLKGKFSIVCPCTITRDKWELYDGKDIERFHTLKQAKAFADAQ